MKLTYLVFCAIATSGIRTSQGNVGDTEAELSKRYGKPAVISQLYPAAGAITHLYHFRGFDILVNLSDGSSWSEFYRKKDRSEITANEIKTIVVANTGLQPPSFRSNEGILTSIAGNTSITYDPLHRALYLTSREQSEQGIP